MKRASGIVCLTVILCGRLGLGGIGPRGASAAPGEAAGAADAAQTEALQQALRAAGAAFKAGDHATALAGFRAAEPAVVARGDLAGFRWNLARTLEALGRHAEALVEYDRALGLPDAPENLRETRQRRDTLLRTWFGALQVRCDVPGTRLRLWVGSDAPAAGSEGEAAPAVPGSEAPTAVPGSEAPAAVPGAEAPTAVPGSEAPAAVPGSEAPAAVPGAEAPVGVDRAEPDAVDCPHTWEPLIIGTHTLEARSPAGVATRQRVRVQPGAASRVELALPAALTVEADAGGMVFIDGKAVGPAPLTDHPVPPGWRAVTVQVDGAVVWRSQINLPAGSQLALDARQPAGVVAARQASVAPPGRAGAWIAGGSAVAAIGAGVALLVLAQGSSDDASARKADYVANPGAFDRATTEAAIDADLADFRRDRALGWGGVGLGAALAGLSAWLFLRDAPAPSAADDPPPRTDLDRTVASPPAP